MKLLHIFLCILVLLASATLTSGCAIAGWPDLAIPATADRPSRDDLRAWEIFRREHIQSDGRVIDNGNNDISHSEGQGMAMLVAATLGDRKSFEKLWKWTQDNINRPDDALTAWKWDWRPAPTNPSGGIIDANNASDGDLFIAWALYRAAERWENRDYALAATAIARDIRRLCITKSAGYTLLLPGEKGFTHPVGTVINLSYYIYPALRVMQRLDPHPDWQRLIDDGIKLTETARFGRWGLPADWLMLDKHGNLQPWSQRPAKFGYDAVRIPLYLVWANADIKPDTATTLAPFREYWAQFDPTQPPPATLDITTSQSSPHAGSNGFMAISRLTLASGAFLPAATTPSTPLQPADWQRAGWITRLTLPPVAPSDDYYSASLILLSRLAARELQAPD